MKRRSFYNYSNNLKNRIKLVEIYNKNVKLCLIKPELILVPFIVILQYLSFRIIFIMKNVHNDIDQFLKNS